jgi:hypothetical protein
MGYGRSFGCNEYKLHDITCHLKYYKKQNYNVMQATMTMHFEERSDQPDMLLSGVGPTINRAGAAQQILRCRQSGLLAEVIYLFIFT